MKRRKQSIYAVSYRGLPVDGLMYRKRHDAAATCSLLNGGPSSYPHSVIRIPV